MEAFTLLKYWLTGGGTSTLFTGDSNFNPRATMKSFATPAAASPHSDYGFDGSYFDLEFTLNPDDETAAGEDDETSETSETGTENPGNVSEKLQMKVKFNVEEVKGPLFSLFAIDNSSKYANQGDGLKHSMQDSGTNSAADERHLAKEILQKYFNMFKPLYNRASSRYVEKKKLSGGGPVCSGAVSPPCTVAKKGGKAAEAAVRSSVKTHQKQGKAGVQVVLKHLGKSRSTSATAAVSPPRKMGSERRDVSLLEVEDGIQAAILYCKRSFNGNREGESAVLSRSVSDPSHEKSDVTGGSDGDTEV